MERERENNVAQLLFSVLPIRYNIIMTKIRALHIMSSNNSHDTILFLEESGNYNNPCYAPV